MSQRSRSWLRSVCACRVGGALFIPAESSNITRHAILLASSGRISGQSGKGGQPALDRLKGARRGGQGGQWASGWVRQWAQPTDKTRFTCTPLLTPRMVCRAGVQPTVGSTLTACQHFLHSRWGYGLVRGSGDQHKQMRSRKRLRRSLQTWLHQGERWKDGSSAAKCLPRPTRAHMLTSPPLQPCLLPLSPCLTWPQPHSLCVLWRASSCPLTQLAKPGSSF